MKTLEDIKNMTSATISAADAAGVVGCDPHWIRVTARQNPEWLGFPVIIYGRRTKIPRIPFIKFFEELPATDIGGH